MPVKLSKKQVETLLAKPTAASRKKADIRFSAELATLKSGEGIFISEDEWKDNGGKAFATTITNYYASKGFIARKSKKTGEVSGESTLEIKRATNEGVAGWILKNI